MGHEEFEMLLYERDSLPQAERERLATHLEECSRCSQLKDSLTMVENKLRSAPSVPAPEGFVARFQQRLDKARQRKRVRVLILTTMLTVIGITAGLGLIIYGLVSYGATLITWLLKAYNQVYWLGAVVNVFVDTAVLFLETLVEQMPLLTLLGASAAITVIAITWLTSFYRLSFRTVRRE